MFALIKQEDRVLLVQKTPDDEWEFPDLNADSSIVEMFGVQGQLGDLLEDDGDLRHAELSELPSSCKDHVGLGWFVLDDSMVGTIPLSDAVENYISDLDSDDDEDSDDEE